jgi:Trk-type K+ transport system membrane component
MNETLFREIVVNGSNQLGPAPLTWITVLQAAAVLGLAVLFWMWLEKSSTIKAKREMLRGLIVRRHK